MGPPTKPHSWCVPPVKILSWTARSFQVIRIWMLLRSGLKVLFTPPKFQFWEILPPKFKSTSFRPPKGISLHGTTRFEPSFVQIWRTVRVRPVANKKKESKKDSGKLAITTHVALSKSKFAICMPGGLQCVVLSLYQVSLKSVQWFCRCGWLKIALCHYFGHWLIQQLVLPYKPWKPTLGHFHGDVLYWSVLQVN